VATRNGVNWGTAAFVFVCAAVLAMAVVDFFHTVWLNFVSRLPQ
jgi:hypothetical protein